MFATWFKAKLQNMSKPNNINPDDSHPCRKTLTTSRRVSYKTGSGETLEYAGPL